MAPLLLYCGVPGSEFPLTRHKCWRTRHKRWRDQHRKGGGVGHKGQWSQHNHRLFDKTEKICYNSITWKHKSIGFGKITFLNIDMGFVVAQAPTKCCFGSERRDYIFLTINEGQSRTNEPQ